MLTALDLIKRNAGSNWPLIEEVAVVAPELSVIPADEIDGTTLEVSVRTGLPTVAFRNANEGVPRTKSTFENRLFQTHIFDAPITIDVAVIKGEKQGVNLMDDETSGVFRAQLLKLSSQFYYGNPSASDKGFPGLMAQYANDAQHVVDAAGTTANTKSSVWALAVSRDGPKFLFPPGGTPNRGEEWRKETVLDGNGNPFTAMVNDATARGGMSVKNKHTAYRIKGLTEDSGKGLTDTLLAKVIELADSQGVQITHFFMTPRSRRQLQTSRTTYSPVGAPAPVPTEYNGIPFVITNGILNTEA